MAWTGVFGSYAELDAVPTDRLVVLPPGVTTRQGAAAMLQGMTAHYLACTTYPIKPGDTCLVHAGAGGVGLLLTQIAKMRGARVVTTVSTEEKAALSREAGADEVVLYTKQDFEEAVKQATGGKGVQVVYDSVGQTTFAQESELPGAARHDGALRTVERSRPAVRRAAAGAARIAVLDAAHAGPLHRRPRRAGTTCERSLRLDCGGHVAPADRFRIPAEGRRQSARSARGPRDDRKSAADTGWRTPMKAMKWKVVTGLSSFVAALACGAATLHTQQPAARALITRATVERWMQELSNWNRWGTGDQLGSLNFVTPEKRKQAMALARTGEVVSLERQVVLQQKDDEIRADGRPSGLSYYEMRFRTFPKGDKRHNDEFNSDIQEFAVHGAGLTHLDALCHYSWHESWTTATRLRASARTAAAPRMGSTISSKASSRAVCS